MWAVLSFIGRAVYQACKYIVVYSVKWGRWAAAHPLLSLVAGAFLYFASRWLDEQTFWGAGLISSLAYSAGSIALFGSLVGWGIGSPGVQRVVGAGGGFFLGFDYLRLLFGNVPWIPLR